MRFALAEAEKAFAENEVPVGCVVARDGEIIGGGHNMVEQLCDVCAHAEIIAMREAASRINNWRLDGTTAYITLEPCGMCAAALILAHIVRIVYGARNRQLGACGTVWDFPNDPNFDRHPIVVGGVLEHECEAIMKLFFAKNRTQ